KRMPARKIQPLRNAARGIKKSGTTANERFCGRTATANPTARPAPKIACQSSRSRSRTARKTSNAQANADRACDEIELRSEYHSSGEPNQIPIAASSECDIRQPINNTPNPATALATITATLYGSEIPSRGNRCSGGRGRNASAHAAL